MYDSVGWWYYEIGKKVRRAIADIGGMMPEEMPTPKMSFAENGPTADDCLTRVLENLYR